jgi:hypothetical protein
MKLATYTPQVQRNTINAQVEAPAAQALANIGNMQGNTLKNFAGIAAKFAEERQVTDVTAAQTEYAKRVSDMLYNEENGLMNRQLANADGVSLAYQDGERKIREDIQKQFKLTGKGLSTFNVMCDKDAAGHWGRLNQYEFNEGQKNKKIVTDNALLQISDEAQTLYNDVSMMNDALGKMRATIDANYYNMGKDYCDAYYRQSAANLVTSSLNVAIRKNDMPGAQVLIDKFGSYVPPSQLRTYAKAVQEYLKQDRMIANAERLYQKYPNNPRAALNAIREQASLTSVDIPYPENGSVQDKAAALAVWVQNNIPNAKVPAAIIFGQWYQETAADGNFGTSPLAKEDFNLGGLTQTQDNGIKQPDGGNYYRHYNSYKEFAESYIKHFIGLYEPPPGGVINTPEEYAHWLKQNGYYGAPEAEYAAGIRRGMELFYKMYPQERKDNINIKEQEKALWNVYEEQNKLKSMEQTAAVTQAKKLFFAAGPNADPAKIALEVAGPNVEMKDDLETMLKTIQSNIHEKGVDETTMFNVRNMIKSGEFGSLLDAIKYVQVPGRMANAKQQEQINTWWKQKLNLEGFFEYQDLNKYIDLETAGIKDQEAKKTRTIQLTNFADNAINAFRAKYQRDPKPYELQQMIAKNVTETKMTVTTSGGQTYEYDNLKLAGAHIVAAEQMAGTDMVSVTFRDPSDSTQQAKNVIMPIQEFVRITGGTIENPWFGGSSNAYEPVEDVTDGNY